MKILVSIYAWTAGMVILGFVLIACILLSYFIPPRKLDPFLKAGCRFLLRALFIKVRVEGADSVDGGRTHLFMANHASLFDVPVLEASRCDLLQRVWSGVPVVWRDGGAVVARAPSDHECARGVP